MAELIIKSLTKACVSLSAKLDDNKDLKDQIISSLPEGHKSIKLEWLRKHIKKPFQAAIIAAFPRTQTMPKTHVTNKWSSLLQYIFPENAAALVQKRKKDYKIRK